MPKKKSEPEESSTMSLADAEALLDAAIKDADIAEMEDAIGSLPMEVDLDVSIIDVELEDEDEQEQFQEKLDAIDEAKEELENAVSELHERFREFCEAIGKEPPW
jgi:DNA repair exonuclease SbcCD ATPase subunit